MIRAGRRAVTVADLARLRGVSTTYFSNKAMHKAPGHPKPISSAGSKPMLWDAEQAQAFYADQPVPALGETHHIDDLLDRHEAAAECGMDVRAWDMLVFRGAAPAPVERDDLPAVTHWRRGDVADLHADRPKTEAGRPKGSKPVVRNPEVRAHAARILAADPATSVATAAQELGISLPTARSLVTELRTEQVQHLLAQRPGLTAEEVVATTGMPAKAAERILAARQASVRTEPPPGSQTLTWREIDAQVEELLHRDPASTPSKAARRLKVPRYAARRSLTSARTMALRNLVNRRPKLDPAAAAAALCASAAEATRLLDHLRADPADLAGEATAAHVLWLVECDPLLHQDQDRLVQAVGRPPDTVRRALQSARAHQVQELVAEGVTSAERVVELTGMPLMAARRQRPAEAVAAAGAGRQEELVRRVAELLDSDPALTARAIAGTLSATEHAVQQAVAEARTRQIAAVLEREPHASAAEVAGRTRMPAWAAERLYERAAGRLRGRGR